MSSRLLAAPLVLAGMLAGAALAREPQPAKTPPPPAAASASKSVAAKPSTAKPAPPLREREPAGALSPARERQKNCAAAWRGLSPAEKTAQGPKWPQFYSTCIKRQKGPTT